MLPTRQDLNLCRNSTRHARPRPLIRSALQTPRRRTKNYESSCLGFRGWPRSSVNLDPSACSSDERNMQPPTPRPASSHHMSRTPSSPQRDRRRAAHVMAAVYSRACQQAHAVSLLCAPLNEYTADGHTVGPCAYFCVDPIFFVFFFATRQKDWSRNTYICSSSWPCMYMYRPTVPLSHSYHLWSTACCLQQLSPTAPLSLCKPRASTSLAVDRSIVSVSFCFSVLSSSRLVSPRCSPSQSRPRPSHAASSASRGACWLPASQPANQLQSNPSPPSLASIEPRTIFFLSLLPLSPFSQLGRKCLNNHHHQQQQQHRRLS
ncbi:hypothetical protein HDK90DRAFT_83560 [Phyllosticta capitalensis]|uniref:Uncharacterized protein n=1 Tax=Phyllosticta capitalensis TaxID=121624 RepID=A0ABR1YC30_9PEZI